MTEPRDPRACIDDILEAIANFEADTSGLDFDQFAADRRIRQPVERNIEIIWGIRTHRLTSLKHAAMRLPERPGS